MTCKAHISRRTLLKGAGGTAIATIGSPDANVLVGAPARRTTHRPAITMNAPTLPAAQRAVVSLRDIEGWSSEEVCNALEVSETNQRVLLHRGRSKLRAALEHYLSEDDA